MGFEIGHLQESSIFLHKNFYVDFQNHFNGHCFHFSAFSLMFSNPFTHPQKPCREVSMYKISAKFKSPTNFGLPPTCDNNRNITLGVYSQSFRYLKVLKKYLEERQLLADSCKYFTGLPNPRVQERVAVGLLKACDRIPSSMEDNIHYMKEYLICQKWCIKG